MPEKFKGDMVFVPIKWYCVHLKRVCPYDSKVRKSVVVFSDAVYNIKYGWICDCGKWVRGNSKYHRVLLWGYRFNSDFL